jgi:type II secretory pathway pseudopilin PulG
VELLLVLALIAALGALVLPVAASRWSGAMLDSAQGEVERGLQAASSRAVATGRACVVSLVRDSEGVALRRSEIAAENGPGFGPGPEDAPGSTSEVASESPTTSERGQSAELVRLRAPFDIEVSGLDDAGTMPEAGAGTTADAESLLSTAVAIALPDGTMLPLVASVTLHDGSRKRAFSISTLRATLVRAAEPAEASADQPAVNVSDSAGAAEAAR